MTYWDGEPTGYTFERATWSGPWGVELSWPWLNPIGFATHETSAKMLEFCKSVLPVNLTATLDEVNRVVGPFHRTVERQVVVSNGAREESFSAGMLANSVIRHGRKRAGELFLVEVKQAGLN
jgi:hypothetical protein